MTLDFTSFSENRINKLLILEFIMMQILKKKEFIFNEVINNQNLIFFDFKLYNL
jgi:hypothetical protein